MNETVRVALLCSLLLAACGRAEVPAAPPPAPEAPPVTAPAPTATTPAPAPEPPPVAHCDVKQGQISREADQRANPWGIKQHLSKNFPDGGVAWLMKEGQYQSFVVATHAQSFGRCEQNDCYVFAAPAEVIRKAVQASMKDGKHDPAALGKALGLPAKNFEGPLRLISLDLDDVPACARLPVESDPGVWKCTSAQDKDCFKFGGYTSGGVPEVLVINAPVQGAKVEVVP
ncbi:MAG TPA: hypothetical protein VFS00_09310 [Polyangiaceae bacterium]|nr:hypothetical protein [Polyangiaceae bacterium]